MEGAMNYIYKLEPDYDTQLECMQPYLDHDFLRGEDTNMDDNEDVTTPNEGDMTKNMDTDDGEYAYDEDEDHNDEETDGAMENDW
ncbi:hypothetical protein AMTR_s00021p00241250 [Amborella trichopoda]|uniref:Uncharacterized protein n=1 Tax=Amborella trichopoda TaxID=13333 RepID=W1Q066_AMBTC|nr:hypothetical protein AMTR_s00021p00241250 [Amborella trichopoda]